MKICPNVVHVNGLGLKLRVNVNPIMKFTLHVSVVWFHHVLHDHVKHGDITLRVNHFCSKKGDVYKKYYSM
jgi:hypothetical protein